MRHLMTLLFAFTVHSLSAQQMIDVDGYQGVIFADTVNLDFKIESLAKRFTPTEQDAFSADKLILKNKENFVEILGRSFRRDMKKSCRQFFGYYDLNGEKHVIIILLKMTNRNSKKYFKDWSRKPIFGFGEFYEKNLKILNVNLTKGEVKLF